MRIVIHSHITFYFIISKFNIYPTFVQRLAACKRFCPGERAVSKESLLVMATASVPGIIVYNETIITRKISGIMGEFPQLQQFINALLQLTTSLLSG